MSSFQETYAKAVAAYYSEGVRAEDESQVGDGDRLPGQEQDSGHAQIGPCVLLGQVVDAEPSGAEVVTQVRIFGDPICSGRK